MKLAGRQIPSFLERPDPSVVAVLVFGPDGGLVRERLQALAGTVVEDLADPFRVAELPASELANDPARLSDEAAAIALTGGRRVVMVRGAGDGQADALRGVLDAPKGDALILVEGGDLGPRSALRGLFEKAKNAAALPCYRDEPQQIEALVDTMLGEAGLSVRQRRGEGVPCRQPRRRPWAHPPPRAVSSRSSFSTRGRTASGQPRGRWKRAWATAPLILRAWPDLDLMSLLCGGRR